MNKHYLHILLLSVLLFFCACSRNTVFSEYKHISHNSWSADSIVCFNFAIADTLSAYDIILSIRHTEQYPYQNMWLFVSDNSTTYGTAADTIEFYLADDRGRWLGNGYGDLHEMPVLYRQHTTFHTADTICIALQQAMRETSLKGISDVGLKIVKSIE